MTTRTPRRPQQTWARSRSGGCRYSVAKSGWSVLSRSATSLRHKRAMALVKHSGRYPGRADSTRNYKPATGPHQRRRRGPSIDESVSSRVAEYRRDPCPMSHLIESARDRAEIGLLAEGRGRQRFLDRLPHLLARCSTPFLSWV